MEDTNLLDEALLEGVDSGRLVAKCGQCKATLTPKNHEMGVCPFCGPLTSERAPLYSAPS